MAEKGNRKSSEDSNLQRYEMMCVISTHFDEEKIKEIFKNINSQIKAAGGIIIREEDLGRKKLAYIIDHQSHGHYGILEFDLPKDTLSELENKFRLSDELLRYLIIKIIPKTEEEVAQEKEKKDIAQTNKMEKIKKEISQEEEKTVEIVSDKIKTEKEKKDDREDKKVSLEDLDKKLDELLDDDVEV